MRPSAGHIGRLSRGRWPPASRTGAGTISLNDAQAYAFSLAATLMVAIVIFKAGDGTHSVTPITEFDGDAEVVAEIDPFAP